MIEEEEWQRQSAQSRKARSRKAQRGSITEGSARRLQIWNDEDEQANGKEARTDASLSLELLSSLRDILQGVVQTVSLPANPCCANAAAVCAARLENKTTATTATKGGTVCMLELWN